MSISYEVRPICAGEWLPDRCMSVKEPLAIHNLAPQYGCPGLLFGEPGIRNRTEFEEFYRNILNRFACCGFIAWEKDKVIGYMNFFPHIIAQKMKFYGWGETEGEQPDTLIHHCISLVQSMNHRHKGIGADLTRHTLEWAKAHKWKRYEVHRVLPDIDAGITNEQKSAVSFWRKFGFSIIGEEEADEETKKLYGADTRYSMALDFNDF